MRKELLTTRDDIFVIHEFLSGDACERLIARIEGIGFDEATVNASGGAVVNKRMRNNERVILDDHELACDYWQKVREYIPSMGGFVAYGLNERFRFYRYEPGQFFDWHFDGPYRRTGDDVSALTFMIYLNDDCEGGTTDFHFGGKLNEWDPQLSIVPRKGTALVFTHNVLHRGAPITAGKKYVARSDVMYHRVRSAG